MELFDKRFVHCMWDDELEEKKCFVADDIGALKAFVETNRRNMLLEVAEGNDNYPFKVDWTDDNLSTKYRFAYYDPNYDAKKAFNEGKKVQAKEIGSLVDWADCDKPIWSEDFLYRVKPEEEKAVIAKRCSGCAHVHCSAVKEPCVSCKPGSSKYEAKLCETCEYLGYSDDSEPCHNCSDENGYPNWEPKEKKYRPYESSAEMIVDFIDRFKVKCPSYCEPLIWVKNKIIDFNRFLVWGFRVSDVSVGGSTVAYDLLFERYVYLDGSPVGMEAK